MIKMSSTKKWPKLSIIQAVLRRYLMCLTKLRATILLGILLWARSGQTNDYLVTDEDFYTTNPAQVQLGNFLMFDKVLSGNKNIACSTCHYPLMFTSDGLSLSIGEGGHGLSISRSTGSGESAITARVPRNAPALFNLGAKEFTTLFHDGRAEINFEYPQGFNSPAGEALPPGLANPLAVQALFPITSEVEMAGHAGENLIADAMINEDYTLAWDLITQRIRTIPEYVELFKTAFSEVQHAEDITIVHIANAIAAYEIDAWRCTNSAFDKFIRGDVDAASLAAIRGGDLFYGKAGCSRCHSGKFQTDQQFHARGVPQIGPGKGDNLPGYSDGLDDFGRERVTKNSDDRFKFRTPSLRQVAFTGPWGHDGAYNTLEAMVRHELDAHTALENYDDTQAVLTAREDLDAMDFVVHKDQNRRQSIANVINTQPIELSDEEFSDLIAFLQALTDFGCIDLRRDIPKRVPSGLPLAD